MPTYDQSASNRFHYPTVCEELRESAVRNRNRRRRSGLQSDNTYDPWGTPYNVRIDGDYDNQLSKSLYCECRGRHRLEHRSDRWSLGADQAVAIRLSGDNEFQHASDDVISWQ